MVNIWNMNLHNVHMVQSIGSPFSTLVWSFAQAHPNELHIPYSIVILHPESSSEPGITLYVRL